MIVDVSIMAPATASIKLDPSTIFLGFEYIVFLLVIIHITIKFEAVDWPFRFRLFFRECFGAVFVLVTRGITGSGTFER
jgi:hypothetical protein